MPLYWMQSRTHSERSIEEESPHTINSNSSSLQIDSKIMFYSLETQNKSSFSYEIKFLFNILGLVSNL